MILAFLRDIGYKEFLTHASRTKALMEIAKYYENPLQSVSDLDKLVAQIQSNYYHSEAFVYAVYFAAWIKSEVSENKRAFKDFDREIEEQIAEGGSI